MSSKEFAEWQAYFSMQPFGHQRWDLGFAIVAATVANSVRDPKKKTEPFTVEDFLLVFDEHQQEQQAERDRERMRSKLDSMFSGKA